MFDDSKCSLCGEPMPPGEEMFNYHGYSGPCPKPKDAAKVCTCDWQTTHCPIHFPDGLPKRAQIKADLTRHLDRIEALERENAAMAKVTDELRAWVEYFGAIERGEVGGSRPTIRTFEKILLDRSRTVLAALASPEAPATSKETP